ncbi:hypothetical protein ACLQ2R_28340 [Streptosporangium sp. DT93]|uniref:hypothetical protein n=1 Tax=Streptosporangium sp. DT93 TaxID=3393428 RepID=UPI003CE8ADC0
MNFCLSDLVPPLRWSDAATIPLLRDQPDLPDAWWRSLPVARVLAVLGPERLAEVLTTIALEHWPAAAVGDVLPALYVLDPEDADEPCTAIALDRAGSWPGLLALTGHELRDQPFIQPVPLLHTLFTAVLVRLAASAPAGDGGAAVRGSSAPSSVIPAEPAPADPPQPESVPVEPVPVESRSVESRSVESRSVEAESVEAESVQPVVEIPEPRAEVEEPEVQATPVIAEAPVIPSRERAADDTSAQDSRDRDAEEDAAPGSLFRPAAAKRSRSEAAPRVASSLWAEPPAKDGTGETEPEPRTALDAEPRAGAGNDIEPEAEAGGRVGAELGGNAPEDRLWAASGDAPHPAEAVPEPVADVGRAETDGADADADADADDSDDHDDGDDERFEPDAGEESGRPVTSLHALVDGVFADVEDKRWAVAQNRLFSDVPATVEALAKLFAVRPDVIRDLEADLRRELAAWVASDEAAPYREHLEAVKDVLGKAAPRERLIDAAEWHTRELRSLDVPAWQFVLACLPGYHLVDEWLVEGDITELRHRTRDMISGAKPPLTINKARDMVSSLGIHPEVSQEWLENVPQLRILGAGERPPQRAGGAPALTVEKPGDGTGGEGGGERDPGRAGREPDDGEPGNGHLGDERPDHPEPAGEPAKAPFRPLKDVSLTRRCFRQPDGRWWLRIDVTADHLQGTECPLPSGFAAYLGMAPGTGRRVSSAVGELALNWQDRPVLESLGMLLADVGAKEGSHLFLTLSDEGVLRARHLPAAGDEIGTTARALRLVGYTAAGGTPEQAVRVIATRVGMSGPAALPDLLARLRERGDRDLLSLLA